MSNKKTIHDRVVEILKTDEKTYLEVGQVIWGEKFEEKQKGYLKLVFHRLKKRGAIEPTPEKRKRCAVYREKTKGNTNKSKTNLEAILEIDINDLFGEFGYKEDVLEKKKAINFFTVFLSYSTLDSDRFQIKNISKILNTYSEIKEALFWETNSGSNIVEYMEKTLKKCNVFVLFCSKNSLNSKAVNDEWQASFQLRKNGSLKIIPVYEDESYIPALLTPLLNIRYLKGDFGEFIFGLRKEILRE